VPHFFTDRRNLGLVDRARLQLRVDHLGVGLDLELFAHDRSIGLDGPAEVGAVEVDDDVDAVGPRLDEQPRIGRVLEPEITPGGGIRRRLQDRRVEPRRPPVVLVEGDPPAVRPPLRDRHTGEIGGPEHRRRDLADPPADVAPDRFAEDDLGFDEALVLGDVTDRVVERILPAGGDQGSVQQRRADLDVGRPAVGGARVVGTSAAQQRHDPEGVEVVAVDGRLVDLDRRGDRSVAAEEAVLDEFRQGVGPQRGAIDARPARSETRRCAFHPTSARSPRD
jgi:hypothetical protein